MTMQMLIRDIQNEQEKLENLKEATMSIIEENNKCLDEFALAKSEHFKQVKRLGKLEAQYGCKVDALEKIIEDLEIKINCLDEEFLESETKSRDDAFELARLKKEIVEAKENHKIEISEKKEEIARLREDVAEERQLDLDMERIYEDLAKTRENEIQEKLKKTIETITERYERTMARLKAQEEPLLYTEECLDAEIEEVTNDLQKKPVELKALKDRYDALCKKLQKVTDKM